MNKAILTEKLTWYEQACCMCIEDLYHTAYIALVNEDIAEKIVTQICVAGVHKYGKSENVEKIRFLLTSDLYHRIKRRLYFHTPNSKILPEPLCALSKTERLIAAIHFCSGISSAESGKILGLSEKIYAKTISDIVRKLPLYPRDEV